MIIYPPVSFEGFFRVQVVNKKKNIVKNDTGWFKNLITNAGLNGYGRGIALAIYTPDDIGIDPNDFCSVNPDDLKGNLLDFVGIGRGDETPTILDTELENQIGTRINDPGPGDGRIVAGPVFTYWEFHRVREFTPEDSTNLSCFIKEVGIFHKQVDGIMWSRQLLPNPIFYKPTPEDSLIINYRLRQYVRTVSAVTGVRIGSQFILCQARDYDVNDWDSKDPGNVWGSFVSANKESARTYEADNMPALTGTQGGNNTLPSTMGIQPYKDNTFYVDRVIRYEADTANFFTGIGSLLGCNLMHRGITTFTPKIQKQEGQVVTLAERWSFNRRSIT